MKALTDLNRFFRTHPLSKDRPLQAWARFISWQLKSRVAEEMQFDWIEGQKLAVRKGMSGATGNIYVGLHEFPDMMVALHFLRNGDLFLDVGANVGTYTVLAAGVCHARTWAFKPDPGAAQHLRRNVAINALQDRVAIHECAVGPSECEVLFTTGLDTMNRVANDAETNGRKVRQSSLDQLLGDNDPIMLKIDVEGYEEEALAGAKKTLAKPSLQLIELETVTPTIIDTLQCNGFERAFYDPFQRKLHRQPVEMKSSNALFVRQWDDVERRLRQARPIRVLGRMI